MSQPITRVHSEISFEPANSDLSIMLYAPYI